MDEEGREDTSPCLTYTPEQRARSEQERNRVLRIENAMNGTAATDETEYISVFVNQTLRFFIISVCVRVHISIQTTQISLRAPLSVCVCSRSVSYRVNNDGVAFVVFFFSLWSFLLFLFFLCVIFFWPQVLCSLSLSPSTDDILKKVINFSPQIPRRSAPPEGCYGQFSCECFA